MNLTITRNMHSQYNRDSKCWRQRAGIKGHYARSITSLVVDEERMMPGHW